MSCIIKSILPPKRPGARATLLFTDGTSRKLLPQVVADRGLYPGMELSDADVSALEAANGAASAKARAVRIISAAGVSKEDLEHRLKQKGESPADARNAVQWLDELHLLDDAETARQIVSRGAARGYGTERIKQMLYEKRIPKQYWEQALAAMPDMTEALRAFLEKRLGPDPDDKQVRSASAAAIRRGYRWEEVRRALEQLKQDPDE